MKPVPPPSPNRDAAADRLAGMLDSGMFRALADPGRMAVLRRVVVTGRASIAEIADGLPQDRSVVSRHLATLEVAGLARSRRVGRMVTYDLDGPMLVARLEALLDAARTLSALCCPPGTDPLQPFANKVRNDPTG